MERKVALVCGAGGFIGGHLVDRLKSDGYWVRGVDIRPHEFRHSSADEFILGDLRSPSFCKEISEDIRFDELYQLAADMGGAGYIFTGEHDADVMHNSATINLNMLERARISRIKRVFFASSACVYPAGRQTEVNNPGLRESDAYPADPDSNYGWEKLFSERLYLAYAKNYKMEVHIARFHNIFGPYGTWRGGREKAPSALCRKVAEVESGDSIEIWGDGEQTRSFLYIDECLEGIVRLMHSTFPGPLNIGSTEMVSINDLASMVMEIAGKRLTVKHVDGPTGVRGRNSDNTLVQQVLGWSPSAPIREGLQKTYSWIAQQNEMMRQAA